jgi:DNA modification methylase
VPETAPGLAVTYVPVDALVPYPRNARTHSKNQIRKIADSIRTFGFTNPLLVENSNVIVAGHGRWEAAKLLGLRDVPTIRLAYLTEEQIRAYIIADNRLAEKAGWDRSILAIELQHLLSIDADFDITITGFEVPEVDLVIQAAANEKSEEKNEDDAFEFDETLPAVAKAGDLWMLGRHRILCGSALDCTAYHAIMSGADAAMVFTDPPYNVRIDGHASGLGAIKHREFAMAAGEMTEREFISFLTRACSLMARHSVDGAIHFVCMDWRHMGELLEAGRLAYTELKNICVWVKDNGGMGSLYRSRHEFVCVFKNGTAQHRNNIQLGQHGRNRTNVWNYPGVNNFGRHGEEGNLLALHPTVKPVALIADAILDCSARGDLILDPFLGSGSTLIAAERIGRACCAIEIDPLYVDTAIRRWERHTGDSAIHAASGKHFDDLAVEVEMRRA